MTVNDVELRAFECFRELAHRRHYGHAAAALGIAQPALSQQIARLERDLGCQLLTRTNRSVGLTAAGREVLAQVEVLLDAASDLQRTATRLTRARGTDLLLGCTRGPLTHVAAEFAHAVPSRFHLTITTVSGADTPGAVQSATVDAVLTWLTPGVRIPDGIEVLATGPAQPLSVAVGSDHPLAQRATLTSTDLADEHVVGVTATLGDDGPPATAVEDLLQQVATGPGIAFLHPCEAAWFHRPDVRYVAVTDGPPVRAGLLWHPDTDGPALRALVDVARRGVRPTDPTDPTEPERDGAPDDRGARRTGEDVRWTSVSSSASDSRASTAASPAPPNTRT